MFARAPPQQALASARAYAPVPHIVGDLRARTSNKQPHAARWGRTCDLGTAHTPDFRSRVFRLAHLIFRLAAQAKRAELGDDSKVGSEDEGDDEDDDYEVEAIVGYNSEEALYEVHVRASQVATLHAL